MTKLTFPFKRPIDEWNPHIVRHVRDKAPEMHGIHYDLLKIISKIPEEHRGEAQAIVGDDKSDVLKANFGEWLTTWNSAQAILNDAKKLGVYPLAYRLEPKLLETTDKDPVEGSKFGGIPDFRHEYRFLRPEGKESLEVISNLWPRCGGCGEHMKFLAGVDLSDWLLPIHYMTANKPTKTRYGNKISRSQIHHVQHSGLGFGSKLGAEYWPSYRLFWNIFYCEEPHFDSPAFDSRIIIEHRNKEDNKGLMDVDTYKKTVEGFVKRHKIKSNIPIQKLEELTLKFDVDIPGEEFVPDWIDNETEKHPEIFGKKADYQFFGHPYSQQTERRYGCQNSFLGLHRMAPIVNWTDNDQDFSYQIYGCLRCQGQESNQIYCKTDGSCT